MGRVYKELPSATELWERFDYKPLTGELVWKGRKAGKIAGSIQSNGYISIGFNADVKNTAHRTVWKWVTGKEPGAFDVEHLDRNRTNNAWNNLRLATRSQNLCNKKAKGYRKMKSGRFQVRVQVSGTIHYFGTYPTEAEARAAYIKASQELHGSFSPYANRCKN